MDKEKLRTWEEVVKELLEERPSLREDDNLLYEEVLRICENRSGMQFRSMSLKCFLESYRALRMEFKVPTMETIGRCRRKVQAENPHLRARSKVEEARQEEQLVFEEWAVS